MTRRAELPARPFSAPIFRPRNFRLEFFLFARFTACGKTKSFVIPRRAARRGISLFLSFNHREIPRFARNDKIIHFSAASLAIAHVHDVDVRSQADVVGQIPAVVVWIVVNYDIVGSPVPIIAITEVIRGNRKIEAAEPEAARASSFNAESVALADAAGKSSVLERMIDVEMSVVLACIVANPLVSLGMDVRSFRMALRVAIGASLFLRLPVLFLRLPALFLRLAGLLL